MSSFPTTDAVQEMLAQASLQNNLFTANSRYFRVAIEKIDIAPGKPVAYLQRRFLPPSGRFQLIQQHTVIQGERLDNIAAQFLGDPTLFWRLCDANDALQAEELTETPGSKLRITLPEGVTGAPL